jgi:hypothetical protein
MPDTPAQADLREAREQLRSVVGVDDYHLDRMTWAAERIDVLEGALQRALDAITWAHDTGPTAALTKIERIIHETRGSR